MICGPSCGFIPAMIIFTFLGRDFVLLKENYSQVEVSRVSTLQECLYHPRRGGFVISTPAAFMHYLMPPQEMRAKTIKISQSDDYPRDRLLAVAVSIGYRRVTVEPTRGFFGKRGIVDIYPLGASTPYRLEYFGDMIESVRRFSIDSQRSLGRGKQLFIPPADELSGSLEATLFGLSA